MAEVLRHLVAKKKKKKCFCNIYISFFVFVIPKSDPLVYCSFVIAIYSWRFSPDFARCFSSYAPGKPFSAVACTDCQLVYLQKNSHPESLLLPIRAYFLLLWNQGISFQALPGQVKLEGKGLTIFHKNIFWDEIIANHWLLSKASIMYIMWLVYLRCFFILKNSNHTIFIVWAW